MALFFAIFGIVLFIADKTGAGTTFFIAGVLTAVPIDRITEKYRIVKWLRIAVVLFLCVVAIINIANTDIPPDAHITGIKFIDQLMAIFRRFADTIFGG